MCQNDVNVKINRQWLWVTLRSFVNRDLSTWYDGYNLEYLVNINKHRLQVLKLECSPGANPVAWETPDWTLPPMINSPYPSTVNSWWNRGPANNEVFAYREDGALFAAIKKGDVRKVRALLGQQHSLMSSTPGWMAIHEAALHGQEACLTALLTGRTILLTNKIDTN